MPKSIKFIFYMICAFGSLCAEESGLAYLKMPVSARGAATMSVFSQISASPFGILENPAGLYGSGFQVGMTHSFWFADVRSDALVGSYPAGKWNLGAGVNFVKIPGIEIRQTPTTAPAGTIESQYLTAATGISYQPFKTLTIGIVSKYVYEHLYTATAGGFAFDLGGRWLAPSSLDLSFLISNLGKMQTLQEERSTFPTTLKIGILRPEIFTEGPLNVSVGLNLVSIVPTQRTYIQGGMEVRITEVVNLRAGFERVGAINRTALGFGIKFGRMQLDYAFIFMPDGLGYPNLLSFSFQPKLADK